MGLSEWAEADGLRLRLVSLGLGLGLSLGWTGVKEAQL